MEVEDDRAPGSVAGEREVGPVEVAVGQPLGESTQGGLQRLDRVEAERPPGRRGQAEPLAHPAHDGGVQRVRLPPQVRRAAAGGHERASGPADLVPSVLAWAEETARAHPPTEGKPLLRVRPRDTDRGLLGLLEGRGFVDLSPEEAAVVGPLVRRATRAMTAVLAPARVYVCLFAEAAAAAHVHFHLIPRFAATPRELRGPRVFDLLREAMAQGRSLVDVAEAEPVAGAIRDRMRDEA